MPRGYQLTTQPAEFTLHWSNSKVFQNFIPVQAIIRGMFDATLSSCKNMITKSHEDFSDPNTTDTVVLWERDIASYVWHESPHDVPLSAMWTPQKNLTAPRKAGGGLTLKAQAYTPATQK